MRAYHGTPHSVQSQLNSVVEAPAENGSRSARKAQLRIHIPSRYGVEGDEWKSEVLRRRYQQHRRAGRQVQEVKSAYTLKQCAQVGKYTEEYSAVSNVLHYFSITSHRCSTMQFVTSCNEFGNEKFSDPMLGCNSPNVIPRQYFQLYGMLNLVQVNFLQSVSEQSYLNERITATCMHSKCPRILLDVTIWTFL